MKKLLTFPIIFVLLVVICTMSSAHAGGWKKSYHAGTFDKNLNYMGGTEIMSLASHKGKLYAATSLWMWGGWGHIFICHFLLNSFNAAIFRYRYGTTASH